MAREIKEDLFGHILGRKFSQFYETNTGTYLSVINNDVQLLDEKAVLPVFAMIQHGFLLAMALCYIAWMNWLLAA